MLKIKNFFKFSPIFRNLPPTAYRLKPSRGFTLIELLMVIAIIGILSSLVLASLNTAKNKGNDTAIKTNLNGIRTQAELYFTDYGSYGTALTPVGACPSSGSTVFSNPIINRQITAAGNASNGGGLARGSCVSSAISWAVSVPLKTDSTKSWCVDSTRASKQVSPSQSPSPPDLGFTNGLCR